MKKHLLFDATTLAHISSVKGANPAGIFRASEQLLSALFDEPSIDVSLTSRPNQIENLYNYVDSSPFASERDIPIVMPTEGRVRRFETSPFESLRQLGGDPGNFRLWVEEKNHIENLVDCIRPDALFLNWRGLDGIPRKLRCPVILIIYDVIALDHSEWFADDGIGIYLRGLLETVRSTDRVMVNSEYVRERVRFHFPRIDNSQIFVNPLAQFKPFEIGSRQVLPAEVENQLQTKDVFLAVGTLEPRKNLITTLAAFARLKSSPQGANSHLLVVGSRGWLSDEIEEVMHSTMLAHPDSITHLGYIDDPLLVDLYKRCTALVFPSLAEGFGLPILEAMENGLPVITSVDGATAEIAGDAALLVNPNSKEDLFLAMSSIASDKEQRASLALKALERSKAYSWEKTSAAVSRELDELVSKFPGQDVSAKEGAFGMGLQPIDGIKEIRNYALSEDIFLICSTWSSSPISTCFPIGKKVIGVGPAHRLIGRDGEKPILEIVSPLTESEEQEIRGLTGTYVPEVIENFTSELFLDIEETLNTSDISLFSEIKEVFAHLEKVGKELVLGILSSFHTGAERIFLVNDWESYLASSPGQSTQVKGILEKLSAMQSFRSSMITLDRPFIPDVVSRGARYTALFGNSLGEYTRSEACAVEETNVVADYFKTLPPRPRVMIDVGAHRGTSAKYFWDDDWKIFCFEPDPENRRHLIARSKEKDNVYVSECAVGSRVESGKPFYTSSESSGISSFVNFSGSHKETSYLEVTTLEKIIEKESLEKIDFLKIDTEGYEFEVLKGLDFEKNMPDVIECEFEDGKTQHKNYGARDLADQLAAKGYSVYVSEWHPIVRYGIPHQWRRLYPYGSIEIPDNSWGNFLAFKYDPGLAKLHSLFQFRLESSPVDDSRTPASRPSAKASSTYSASSTSKRNGNSRKKIVSVLKSRVPRTFRVLRGLYKRIGTLSFRKVANSRPKRTLVGFVTVLAICLGIAASREAGSPSSIEGLYPISFLLLIALGVFGYRKLLKRARSNRLRIERVSNRLVSGEREVVDSRKAAAVLEQRLQETEERFSREVELESSKLEVLSERLLRDVADSRKAAAVLKQRLQETEERLSRLEGVSEVEVARVSESLERSWMALKSALRSEGLGSSRAADVVGLYQLLLDREVEDSEMLAKWVLSDKTILDIRNEIMSSREFLRKHPSEAGSLTGFETGNQVETYVSDAQLRNLFERVQDTWLQLGSNDVHWSVLSHEKFRSVTFEQHSDEFWDSGEKTIELVKKTLERCGHETQGRQKVLDFGCGVGRLTFPLSLLCDRVTGVDISASHLAMARQEAALRHATDIEFELWSPFDWDSSPRFDLAVSIISLQHSAPPLIAKSLTDILTSLTRGGLAVIQLATFLPRYQFLLSDYLSRTNKGEMEVHAIPQRLIFEISKQCNAEVLEVLEDGSLGSTPGALSNLFVFRKI